MPGPSKNSKFIQRCVADVAGAGKDTSSAFAICTAQSQKSGYSEPGSRKSTARGAAKERVFGKKDDMGAKSKAYEKAVKRGRNESMAGVFANLEEGGKGAPALQDAPRQDAFLKLFPKDFTSQGWHTLLYQLGIPEGKAAEWKVAQRVEIGCKAVRVAYEKD